MHALAREYVSTKTQVNILSGRAAIDAIEAAQYLTTSMDTPSFFCTNSWLQAVVRVNQLKLVVFTVRDDENRLIGLLPTYKQRNVFGGVDLLYVGDQYYPDPLGIICSAENRPHVLDALREFLAHNVIADRIILRWFSACELEELMFRHISSIPAPYLSLPKDVDLLLAGFKKKKRYNMNANVRKAMEHGCKFTRPDTVSEKIQALEDLFVLHEIRAKERGIRSTFERKYVYEFHRYLAENASEVTFYTLSEGGVTIAVLYGFVFANRFQYYQVAHHPSYGDLSPGSVLLYLAIKDCCRKGIEEFNFLQGNEDYKKTWTNKARELHTGVYYGQSFRGVLLSISDSITKRAKRIIVRYWNGHKAEAV